MKFRDYNAKGSADEVTHHYIGRKVCQCLYTQPSCKQWRQRSKTVEQDFFVPHFRVIIKVNLYGKKRSGRGICNVTAVHGVSLVTALALVVRKVIVILDGP